jgi:hypothetical protein
MTAKRTLRIGGASGFWGDSAISVPQLLAAGVDYLIFDYLAEITMSIMARARAKDASLGYAVDFVSVVAANLPAIAARKVRIVANAGGVNPQACADALRAEIARAGFDLKVAVVAGDDLMDRAGAFRGKGVVEMFDGRPLPDALLSMNAYLGGLPIARALETGADIVVTGRCVDSAMALGPCIHEFGWERDLDRYAAASLAGHILECGAQASGGIHTDWDETGDWAEIGYPIVEIGDDGNFVVSKPEGTGGLVSVGTVAEQMVYEIGDPQNYLLPDVTCDFSAVAIRQIADNLVDVRGARGRPPSPFYKVSATYKDGFRVGMYLTIIGPRAAGKAERTADAVLRRMARMLAERGLPLLSETSVEVIGAEAAYGPHSRARNAREVVLKVAAKHPQPHALQMLVRELTSSGTSMAPGTTGLGGNRPKVAPVVRLFSFLVEQKDVPVRVETPDGAFAILPHDVLPEIVPERPEAPSAPSAGALVEAPLEALAYIRSGDKGDNANIGIVARRPEYLSYIRRTLSEAAVAGVFAHFLAGKVERFDLPGVHGVNFLLHRVLGGGGIASLRNDPQAKGFGQMLADFPVPVPPELLPASERR